MRRDSHGPPRWGRALALALCGLLGGLVAAPARAANFYENSISRPYFFGMGDVRCAGGLVDVPTGAVKLSFPLLKLSWRLAPEISFYYNSHDNSDGPLGKGTSLSLSWKTWVDGSNKLFVIAPGHRRYRFDYVYDPYINASWYQDSRDPEMLGAKFTQGQFEWGMGGTLKLKDGTQLTFSNNGDCYRIRDRVGNPVDIDGGDFPAGIHRMSNYVPRIDFTYTNGKLTRITDGALPRSWNFAYDASGRLSTVTNPLGGVTTYTWTTYTRSDGVVLPLLATVTNPRGFQSVALQYDSSGRATRVTAADGGITQISYTAALGADGTTTLTDPRANTTSWSYVWPLLGGVKYGYRLTGVTDPLGRTTTYAAEIPGCQLITKITDFLGRVTTQGWDTDKGNLLSRTTPTASGGTQTTSWQYEPNCSQCTRETDPLGRTSSSTVDPATGNVTATSDKRGNRTDYSYDSSTQDLTSVTYPPTSPGNAPYWPEYRFYQHDAYSGVVTYVADHTGQRAAYTYDNADRVLTAADGNNKVTSYTRDLLDRVTAVSRTVGGVTLTTSYEYDADGNRTALVDPKGQRWEWTFDSMDRVVQDKNPLLQTRSYTWDQNSNLTVRTDRVGQRWEYVYGTGDRPSQQTFKRADSTLEATVSYTYDPLTKLLSSVTDSQYGTTSWGYDSLDRITSESGPNGTVTLVLDNLGRRTSMTATGQGTVTYAYDQNDNLTDIAQNGQNIHFTRDALNRIVNRILPNGVNTTWSIDWNGYLTSMGSWLNGTTLIDSHGYTRDRENNITQVTDNGLNSSYSYDDLYRLVSSNVQGVASSWIYDAVGNRSSQTVGGVSTSYTYNSANRLTAVNGVTVTSDANGNVTAYNGDSYTWDVRGRLAGLSRTGLTASFGYRQDGIRTSKTVNGTTTSYLLDGDSILKETTGGVATDVFQGPGVDAVLKRGSRWLTPDGLGSTATLTDSAGAIQQRYYYQPFGQGMPQPSPGDPQPFQFAGRENDGTGLYYCRARYYVPDWGRFLSEDPEEFRAGVNFYAYVGNNPVNLTDPSGRNLPDPEIEKLILDLSRPPTPGEQVVGFLLGLFISAHPSDEMYPKDMTVEEIVNRYRKGSIRTEGGKSLGKYMNKTWGEVLRDAKNGERDAQSTRKLLTTNQYKR
jgi:RHS repeat-associated protein